MRDGTHSAVSPLPPRLGERVVGLLDVQAEEVGGGEVLAALGAAVGVLVAIMGLVGSVGRERDGLAVGRQRAAHRNFAAAVEVAVGQIELGDFGGRWRDLAVRVDDGLFHRGPMVVVMVVVVVGPWRGKGCGVR